MSHFANIQLSELRTRQIFHHSIHLAEIDEAQNASLMSDILPQDCEEYLWGYGLPEHL
jgi:hypothetical protein